MMTARAERIHIGIFGKTNAGKSSLLNTLTGQETSIVSEKKGTTTDPVYKPMEVHGLGPVVFIDTAGIDDEGDLGHLRVQKSLEIIDRCDAFIYLLSLDYEPILEILESKNKPIIYLVSKADLAESREIYEIHKDKNPFEFISFDEKKKYELLDLLKDKLKKDDERTITQNLVKKGDNVLLVTPQDIQAPKGRLIMAQVQTIRELLDKKALIHISSLDNLGDILASLKNDPDLVITDSQFFGEVSKIVPKESKLTSFSVLISAYKGDLTYFKDSLKVFENPEKLNRILIAEACTHPPLEEDIGRVKIPNLLRKKFNKDFQFDFARGDDFKNLHDYDLIIHCGACMFNRSHLMSRVEKAMEEKIPMTNYGLLIAYLKGILDQVELPE